MKPIKKLSYYAGIGSRKTPSDILKLIESLSRKFAQEGLTLRSGGAPGADYYFEKGCDQLKGYKEIYLPWTNFNDNKSNLSNPLVQAFEIAKTIHPHWNKCSQAAKKLHARNIHQILGKDLQCPVSFVIYYAEMQGEKVKGGTATAVNLAIKLKVPTFNLIDPIIKKHWETYLTQKTKTKSTKTPQIA